MAQLVGQPAQVFGFGFLNHARPFVMFESIAARNSVKQASDRFSSDFRCCHTLFDWIR
jgi:hypothetical protein